MLHYQLLFKLASESKVVLSPTFIPDFDILNTFEYQVTEALIEKKKLSVDEISKLIGIPEGSASAENDDRATNHCYGRGA